VDRCAYGKAIQGRSQVLFEVFHAILIAEFGELILLLKQIADNPPRPVDEVD
jgi:hypothetical protein